MLLPTNSTGVTFNVTSHHVGQVTTYLQCNSTDVSNLSRWVEAQQPVSCSWLASGASPRLLDQRTCLFQDSQRQPVLLTSSCPVSLCPQDPLHGHPQQRRGHPQPDHWLDLLPALVPVLLPTGLGELEEEKVLLCLGELGRASVLAQQRVAASASLAHAVAPSVL